MQRRTGMPAFRKIVFMGSAGVLLAAYVVIRIYFVLFAAHNACPITDTAVFTNMGNEPLFSKAFLAGLRSPLVPLMYKVFDGNFTSIIVVQTIVSITCWLFLAWTLVCCVRSRVVKTGAFLVVVLVGISEPVMLWESCLLSESISVSLLAAVTGCWLLFMIRSSWKRLIGLLGVSLLWLFSKEVNAWMLLLGGMVCLPVAVVMKEKKYLLLSAGLIIAFVVNDISSNIGKRWVFPFLNVLSQRILTDSGRTDYFIRQGMPVSDALLGMTNICASSKNYAFYQAPELATFRQWLYKNGKRSYMLWLVTHPASTLREPLANIECMAASGIPQWYTSPGSKRLLPVIVGKCMFPIGYERYSLLAVWLLVLCTGIALGAQAWKGNTVWRIAIILALLSYPHLLIVWHGDTMEIQRHAMGVRVQMNLAWWIMICLFADRLISRFDLGKRISWHQRRT